MLHIIPQLSLVFTSNINKGIGVHVCSSKHIKIILCQKMMGAHAEEKEKVFALVLLVVLPLQSAPFYVDIKAVMLLSGIKCY